jgi:hypothetical protein
MTLAAMRHHRLFPRFAILAGGASALAIGLLTVGAVLSTKSDARTASTPTFSTFERVVEVPEMLAIVPSPSSQVASSFSGPATVVLDIISKNPLSERGGGQG